MAAGVENAQFQFASCKLLQASQSMVTLAVGRGHAMLAFVADAIHPILAWAAILSAHGSQLSHWMGCSGRTDD